MNVFVLCTGRCGSMTFAKAFGHAWNYSSGHETLSGVIGAQRLAYPQRHIEADNRLAWFLGRLDEAYGDRAAYIHLRRDRAATAASFERRYREGIIYAYRSAILMGANEYVPPRSVCLDYVDTVNANILAFLRDKTSVFTVNLESARGDFAAAWSGVGAEGDIDAALSEWDIRYNASSC